MKLRLNFNFLIKLCTIYYGYIQYITLHFELDLVFLVKGAQLQVSPFLPSGHYENSY